MDHKTKWKNHLEISFELRWKFSMIEIHKKNGYFQKEFTTNNTEV